MSNDTDTPIDMSQDPPINSETGEPWKPGDKGWTSLNTDVLDAVYAFKAAVWDKLSPDDEDIAEYFGDLTLPPRVLGQILMQNLSHVIDGRAMNLHQKQYWLTVADQMGPDWIEQFNRVGIYMQMVDKL